MRVRYEGQLRAMTCEKQKIEEELKTLKPKEPENKDAF